ncbi:pentatricopeptide repeat-containing protein At5g19020, mitochondrial [Dendrobium catenatum]|uniref:Pentatricopeptide repeat-containing protein n=1 Tax=Dendrobium catenatum TaxID=906689 RepID=A0A2I0WDF8_9ASPA|nr:pentatricopeptide repeat-containing protein At5g19020, mitochondrial [Dendrobium catenatum]XP_028553075.1 pentatricopeptide repeat-containing protein At5g19020, mitochondrial [Dendrobium catenatum]XP_028553076.1 pentatricopeptide repeat-containing protein At5g19020, mitochondrial [Dendrobium catenatum]XP_028553077.1 pentatricopeptide repeat-containing protein At5g19020, mitochondrial [Dendrobium catenatum]XP_028553078.1 pentatricopeptide repeat-containing protein At5g19020, mitochondrial [De
MQCPTQLERSSPTSSNNQPGLSFSLVSALKSAASSFKLSSGEQLHSLALKSGLLRSNLFVSNALIHLYARCGHLPCARQLFLSATLLNTASWNIMLAAHFRCSRPDFYLDHARSLFDEMPHKDKVSFTSMIMGLARHGSAAEAFVLFRSMMAAGVTPNEVTLASVISSCSRLKNPAIGMGKMAHAVAVKCGLDELILVATNLVHDYAVSSNFDDAEAVFGGMSEKNTVTWNVLLKGYAKARLIKAAISVFDRIPEKDMVSWGTMIDGYLLSNSLEEALLTFREMLKDFNARPNEVMLVNLVSSCSLRSAISEGQQLHAVILKAGLDCHPFVQATLIHLYSECSRMDLAFLQFQSGSKENISSWNAVIAGFMQNNDLAAAEHLFAEMPERDVVSWSSMIAGYAQHGHHETALGLFREMWSAGIQPNEITLLSVLSAVAGCSSLEEGKWLHDYINRSSVPLTDNLCASLIDMYAKCGSIKNAIQLFNYVRETYAGISSWNAVICGSAMHGHADASIALFSDLLKTRIKPNSITFLGVLSACCHAGLVDIGRKYFKSIESVYYLKPSIKHYGCMVDLLGRAGHLEEAEKLIESMPMEADVVIWGSLLASARTHKKIEIGERAAEKLARLDPGHGAGRVLISNIYADDARWEDVCLVRRAIWSGGLKKEAGQSSVL